MLQQARVRQLLRDGHQRVAVRLLLVNGAQLVQQRLQARQQVAHADLLARPPDQRLLEFEFLEAIFVLLRLLLLHLFLLLCLFLLFYDCSFGGCVSPAARCHVAWRRV